jgi:hypothetical protein
MLASRTKAIVAVVFGCVGFLAILDPAPRAANAALTGCDGAAEELADQDVDGPGGPVGQGENGPDGDNGAPGSDGNKVIDGAIGPSGVRKGPSGEPGAPGAMGENGQARAPPLSLSANPTGAGA